MGNKYTDDIDQYYQKASVIISSAGAGSIAELSQYKKKIILFPNKTSKYNHQMINAGYADFIYWLTIMIKYYPI